MLRSIIYACRKPRNIPRPGADSSGNPHPDQTAANKAKGVDVYLILQYTRQGLKAPTYKVSSSVCLPEAVSSLRLLLWPSGTHNS
jgi:hypothetical protein